MLTFVSKRHIGMPYGLTIYLDGMMDSRVSACCEYRHQCGKLLGSKTAHFKLIKVEGGKPCYRLVNITTHIVQVNNCETFAGVRLSATRNTYKKDRIGKSNMSLKALLL